MPVFEYKCDSCGEKVEFLERSGSKTAKKCPQCGSGNLQRQLSVFSPGIKQGQSKKCHGCTDFSCPHAGA